MGFYWYFEFHVHDPVTGFADDDYSIASSQEKYFPIDAVLTWKDEEFGTAAKIQISWSISV